jgi:hypothetical protein
MTSVTDPAQLTAASFAAYPPEARQFATAHLALLQQLPLAVAPAFLREIIVYDWRFPAERRTFERQCAWLQSLPAEERAALLAPFRQISLPAALQAKDWVAAPQAMLEEITAHLWTTSQIDAYRRAAQDLLAVPPDPNVVKQERCVIVVVGKDAVAPSPLLFRKLAPHGVTLRNLQWTDATPRELQTVLTTRAARTPYSHWYIDGGPPWPHDAGELDLLSYAQLRPVRETVLERMNRFTHSGPGGPEAMRTQMSALKPSESGADAVTSDPRMQHFINALFAEGSGTQIYSTSFVQWAARETLRRAQPQQLLVRFAPRQRQRTLNQMFDAATNVEVPDPEGSLRDADMGAYYIWLDLMRIAAPGRITFLAWREGQRHAVLITPRTPAGKSDDAPLTLAAALKKYT